MGGKLSARTYTFYGLLVIRKQYKFRMIKVFMDICPRENFSIAVSGDQNCRSPRVYHQTMQFLDEFFRHHLKELNTISALAVGIKEGIEKISPFIQQSTEKVCPNCTGVCCISKHGYYSCEDLVYLRALGLKPPPFEFGRKDSAPCQYLAESGCSIERPYRPSGCNWYFCDSLLECMETISGYRTFDDTLQDIANLWIQMMEEFKRIQPLHKL